MRYQYCGVRTYTSEDKNASYTLPRNSGGYGRAHVLCTYQYFNEKKDDPVYLTIRLGTNVLANINMNIEAFFFDNSNDTKYVDNANYNALIDKCLEVRINYWSHDAFQELPFTIGIKIQKPGISITLIITIVLVVAACLICSISIWIFSRKIARRNALAAQNMGNMYVGGIRIHPGETEEMLKKRKMKQLQGLLNSVLISRVFEKELSKYNLNCTICFDEYNSSSNVCLTECKHVFHYECIKSWLTKNLLNPKCPNCNFILLPDVNNPDEAGDDATQSIPFVSGRASNQRSNRNNNNVVNNFVEGGSGGMRVANNNSSTRVIMPINGNLNNNHHD